MRALEIGDFKEDVGAALARASSGEVVTLTEEGQPVAELGPVRMSTYAQLRELGLERPAMADLDAYQMPSKNLPDGRGIVGNWTSKRPARGSVSATPGAWRGSWAPRAAGPRATDASGSARVAVRARPDTAPPKTTSGQR